MDESGALERPAMTLLSPRHLEAEAQEDAMRKPGKRFAPNRGCRPRHFCAPPSNEKNSAVERHTVWTRTFALLFGVITLATGCASDGDDSRFDLVLLGGNVIDVESGETLRDRDIWIVGDRIDAITPNGEKRVPRGTGTIDVRDHFVVPGLVDAHVHLDHVDELEFYTAFGVTTVFNMRGLPRHLEWRNSISRGELEGPTIYTTGAIESLEDSLAIHPYSPDARQKLAELTGEITDAAGE